MTMGRCLPFVVVAFLFAVTNIVIAGGVCPNETTGNCQPFVDAPDGIASSITADYGSVFAADDFIPQFDTLTSVCVWGVPLPASQNCEARFGSSFRVRVLGSDADGLPDVFNVVGEAFASTFDVSTEPVAGAANAATKYHIPLDTPITGLTVDGSTCYWLEVVNTSFSASNDGCVWFWRAGQGSGSGFSALATFGNYGSGSPYPIDLAFCLNGAFTPGCAPEVGQCCHCDGTCSDLSRTDCLVASGQWRIGASCADLTCEPGPPANDTCTAALLANAPLRDGSTVMDSECAGTDGINPVAEKNVTVLLDIGGDVWFNYVATCNGTVRFRVDSTIPSGGLTSFSPRLVVYRDPDNPTTCVCPIDAAKQDAAVAWYESPVGQAPIHAAPAVSGQAYVGDCFTIRAASRRAFGQASDFVRGQAKVSVVCQRPVCLPIENHYGPFTNRFLLLEDYYFCPMPSRPIALRLQRVSLNGSPVPAAPPLYVGPLQQSPDETSADPTQTITVGALQCEPYFDTWVGSPRARFHVYGAEIIPEAIYAFDYAPKSCVDLQDPTCWRGLAVVSTGLWGDVAAPFFSFENPVTVDFKDVAALVGKFLAAPDAPSKVFAQLVPNVVLPDRAVNFKDISAGVQAFLSVPFSETTGITGACVCPSTVVCGAVACSGDNACGDGFCVNGFCMDACGRCRP